MITNAFKNSRSEYTFGCPRPRLVGSVGIGKLSTNWTNVTSNESWDTIGLPPILVVFDYHNDRSKPSLEQPSSEGFLFMTRPQLAKLSRTCYERRGPEPGRRTIPMRTYDDIAEW